MSDQQQQPSPTPPPETTESQVVTRTFDRETRFKAFDYASEVVKQLLTLSTAVLALTVTFAKDIASAKTAGTHVLLWGSWFLYLVSVVFGIWTLMALAGQLEQLDEDHPAPTTRAKAVTYPAGLQIVCFVGGLLASILYAYKSI